MANDNTPHAWRTINFTKGIAVRGKLIGNHRLEDIFSGEELEFLERNGIKNIVVEEFAMALNGNSRAKYLDHYRAFIHLYHYSVIEPIHVSVGTGTSIRDAMRDAYRAAKAYIKRR